MGIVNPTAIRYIINTFRQLIFIGLKFKILQHFLGGFTISEYLCKSESLLVISVKLRGRNYSDYRMKFNYKGLILFSVSSRNIST